MLRRLLFVLLGLAGAAVAAVLWSGTAYASTPHGLAVPPVRVPAPPSVPLPTLPHAGAPHATTPAPPAPIAVPPVVQRALTIVPPVVDRTVHTVRTVVPVSLPVVSLPVPERVTTLARPARHSFATPVIHRAASKRPAFVTDTARGSSASVHASSSTRDRAKSPATPRRRAPVGDLADGANRAPQTANGMPFAVTRASAVLADTSCRRVTFLRSRVPGVVPLRDVARPG